MEEFIKVNGKIINFMEKVYTHGLMVEDMKDSMNMTRSTGMELTTGQTVNVMMVSGWMESSMEKLDILTKKEKVKMEFGKMENV
jgi:hypothetical protein